MFWAGLRAVPWADVEINLCLLATFYFCVFDDFMIWTIFGSDGGTFASNIAWFSMLSTA